MSDLISRQAAIDEWRNDFKGYVNALNIPRDDYKGIMAYIDELPSAQPKIIRCKDCKHYNGEDRDICCPLADYAQSKCGADWFCADAERRTDARFNQQTGGD